MSPPSLVTELRVRFCGPPARSDGGLLSRAIEVRAVGDRPGDDRRAHRRWGIGASAGRRARAAGSRGRPHRDIRYPGPAARPGADRLRPAGRSADRRQRRRRIGQDQQRRERRDDRRAGPAAPAGGHRRGLSLHLAQRRDGFRRSEPGGRRAARPGACARQPAAATGRDRQPLPRLRRRQRRARRPRRRARQPRLHGHAVQHDDLHREVHRRNQRPGPWSMSSPSIRRSGRSTPGRLRRPHAYARFPGRHRRHDFNGLYGVTPIFNVDLAGIDRVEVFRGPIGDAERHGAQRGDRRHHQFRAQARHPRRHHPVHRALSQQRPVRRQPRRRPPLWPGRSAGVRPMRRSRAATRRSPTTPTRCST